MKLKLIFIMLTFISYVSCAQTNNKENNLSFEYAKSELKEAKTNKTKKQILVDTVITNKKNAVTIAEAILFEIYGKENIERQKPYKINKIDGYWIINGTLPKNTVGGTFLIILNSVNGEIIKLTHGK